MNALDIDFGVRCDDHVGEVFPPRCDECAALNEAEHGSDERGLHTLQTPDGQVARLGLLPGTECDLHPAYPLPCARCARDAAEHHE